MQRVSAPCTWAKASVPSRTYAPSAPRRCAHGSERQGRSVARAEGPTPPSSTAPPLLTPPRRCLRGVPATPGLRTSGPSGTPVCAAVGGPVSAATLKRPLRDWTAPALRWAARRCSGPPSARQRARTDAAPCLPDPPPGPQKEGTGAAALCPCHAGRRKLALRLQHSRLVAGGSGIGGRRLWGLGTPRPLPAEAGCRSIGLLLPGCVLPGPSGPVLPRRRQDACLILAGVLLGANPGSRLAAAGCCGVFSSWKATQGNRRSLLRQGPGA